MSVFLWRTLLTVIISCSVVACGGGGGGGSATPPVARAPQNSPPSANAGANQTVGEQTAVTVTGSATDTDGSIASYSWTQTEGASVTLSGASSMELSFTSPSVGSPETLTFLLTVTDNDGATASDTVSITVGNRSLLSDVSFSDSNLGQCVTDTGLTYVDELTGLFCADLGIADATGIEYLFALTQLLLNNNQLAAINVAANTALVELSLADNQLTSIDLSANTALTGLWLNANQLTSIDVSTNTVLTQLDLKDNDNIPCHEIQSIQTQFPTLQLSHNVAGCESGTWIPGQFESAAMFAAQCVAPRIGIDPSTGLSFPDVAGTRLEENNWLRSWSNDLYLWYDEITDLDPADYSTPAYFDLLKTFETTPSENPKDRFHSSIETDEFLALSQSGVSAGYGATFVFIRPSPPRQVVVAYTEPNSPATSAPANLARGATLLEIDGVDVVFGADVSTLNAGTFPSGPNESHDFTVQDLGSSESRSFTMVSQLVTSVPVQNVGTIDTASGTVGYVLFNDHIATAEQLLIDAVNQLKDANVSDLVLDLRYNSGGFLAIASGLAYMIAGPGSTAGQAFEELQFNDKHTVFNPVTGQLLTPWSFLDTASDNEPLPSLDLNRIYVLTGPGTCSASEAIMNSLRGVDVEVIQIGSTTCGKPYGFYPTDNCGTTYFSIHFRGINAKGFGDYADGFSPSNTNPIEGTEIPGCSVADDFTHALGDPQEGRLAAALAYRVDQTCPAPSGLVARRSARFAADLSAADGTMYKSLWLQNRIIWR